MKIKRFDLKTKSTLFLKLAITFVGLGTIAICALLLPDALMSELRPGSDFDYGPLILIFYVTEIPFLLALYTVLRLLQNIDHRHAFSSSSVDALRTIHYCAFIIAIIYTLMMPYIFYLANRDDAPGVAALGFIVIGVSLVISSAAELLQRLVRQAIDIKQENDLTV